ncbi:ATP-grasp domain-containing protein [Xanthobacter agilis]|uniref:ATP-grasp superfamily ATP-dependent carboligase n=1 Tax=Xanthobacter agilis TaxID=47492 RepID=A0ABU0LER6_XANAG|nr:ATP-grasp domain-containing protein [Xanthobacter agilis]MDQ0505644.1 putative ATP-grasp superfamily ATP-dependent carboligase [Xanthobacter agilis]
MRVFICEFVTAGGLRGQDLPETLVPEGTRMRDALIADIEALPGVGGLLLAHDDRLPAPQASSVPVGANDDPWAIWAGLAAQADVVWPIAPETHGLIARLIRLMRAQCAHVVACDLAAVEICSSKFLTAQRLAAMALPHVPTFRAAAPPPELTGPVVTKPDDGAGCENTRRWASPDAAPRDPDLIIQPFVEGTPASLTVLVRPDGVTLLTVNRQHLTETDGMLSLSGLTVGALGEDERLARLVPAVVAAIPGLSGIIGIDIILTPAGPVVVEVNPRITTSYAGLHQALAINPAAFLPEFIRDGRLPAMPHLPAASPVEVVLR